MVVLRGINNLSYFNFNNNTLRSQLLKVVFRGVSGGLSVQGTIYRKIFSINISRMICCSGFEE